MSPYGNKIKMIHCLQKCDSVAVAGLLGTVVKASYFRTSAQMSITSSARGIHFFSNTFIVLLCTSHQKTLWRIMAPVTKMKCHSVCFILIVWKVEFVHYSLLVCSSESISGHSGTLTLSQGTKHKRVTLYQEQQKAVCRGTGSTWRTLLFPGSVASYGISSAWIWWEMTGSRQGLSNEAPARQEGRPCSGYASWTLAC